METWLKTTIILCALGLLKEIRPSEPFVESFLVHFKNLTSVQVNQNVFPVMTYSYMSQLVLVFLLTDFLRYKSVIILESLAGTVTWGFLVWGKTLFEIQIAEVLYGTFVATDVAYFTYIYAKTDKRDYLKVTGYTRAAALVGKTLSGSSAQIFFSTGILNLLEVNYVCLATQFLSTIWACFLPSVKSSVYFHRQDTTVPAEKDGEGHEGLGEGDKKDHKQSKMTVIKKIKIAREYLWRDFKIAYSNPEVVKWSTWWVFATCGFLQGTTYIQILWDEILEEGSEAYNGLIDSLYTVIGAASAVLISKLPVDWTIYGNCVLGTVSILEAIVMGISASAVTIYPVYACYVIFGVLYHTFLTVATAQVAKQLPDDSHGLIFGVNTFLSVVLQTILTAIAVSENGFALPPRPHYAVISVFFLMLGIGFFFLSVVSFCRKRFLCVKQTTYDE